MIGKSDFDFHKKEVAQIYYDEEQKIIKTGKGFTNKIVHELTKNGVDQWVSITKLPLYDEKGNCIGTFGTSKDVSSIKELEMETKERNEELASQEEELRQNLEEMQTIQEELAKEKYLTDTLLGNIPESIYFKDLESKFIKSSNSMAKLFGLSSPADLIGKSDFDFFGEEHARPAYEDEQRIIKTGKPIIDLVEKEVKKDGSVSWVTTTKMPLKDQNGKIVGTFGISKDITEQRKIEIDVVEKNEALQAQEEELRQNLEEMQTIQEDLQRNIAENEKMQEELEKKRH